MISIFWLFLIKILLTIDYLIFISVLVNGETETVGCNKMTREEICKWLNWLKTRSGLPEMRYMKMWHTDNPSIQGVWSPFTHRDPALNIATFPRVWIFFFTNIIPRLLHILLL